MTKGASDAGKKTPDAAAIAISLQKLQALVSLMQSGDISSSEHGYDGGSGHDEESAASSVCDVGGNDPPATDYRGGEVVGNNEQWRKASQVRQIGSHPGKFAAADGSDGRTTIWR
ncbi:hypothetical protein PI125_g7264 [Phytophthora idaei]|nr:hypothetical protein PI125_g7264 [Phytophthora idaei]KAG3160672.1 hypothetical protein PI126_g6777 [Phytophthora idaei]